MAQGSGSYGQCSVPNEDYCWNKEAFCQTSDANMDDYTRPDAMVMSNDGRRVPIPGIAQYHQQPLLASCSEEQLPPFPFSTPTEEFAENTHQAYITASNSSSAALPDLSPLVGSSFFDHTSPMWSAQSAKRQNFQESIGSYYSLSADSNWSSSSAGQSHMMSLAVGSGVGGRGNLMDKFLRLNDPLLSQSGPTSGREDYESGVLMRKSDEPSVLLCPSHQCILADLEPFQASVDSHSFSIGSDCLARPVQVQPWNTPVLESHPGNQSLELTLHQSANETSLVTIRRASFPQDLHGDRQMDTEEEVDSNKDSATATSAADQSEVVSSSPPTYGDLSSPCPATPFGATTSVTRPPTQVACMQAVTPAPSVMPMTPAMTPCLSLQTLSSNSFFELNNFKDKSNRLFEISPRNDISDDMKEFAHYFNYFSWELDRNYKKCASGTFEISTAVHHVAKMCESNYDARTGKLTFTMPRDCMRSDEWTHRHRGDVDLRDRQLVVLQVAKLLAYIHCNGSDDKLGLSGNFIVCVTQSKQVYVLVDFHAIAIKQMRTLVDMTDDPRVADVKALKRLYQSVLQPFINFGSSWVSPGMRKVLEVFETLISNPSVDSMARLVRHLGYRRLCKLEVEVISLSLNIFCSEHEPLSEALSDIETMLPRVSCGWWEWHFGDSGEPVPQNTVAIAHPCMHLRAIHVQRPMSSFFVTVQNTLCFNQE